MAVINVPGHEPWIVARWALEELVDEAKPELADPDDVFALDQAVALDGLHFDMIEPDQARRLAATLSVASGRLVQGLSERASADALDESVARSLVKLQVMLRAFPGHPGQTDVGS